MVAAWPDRSQRSVPVPFGRLWITTAVALAGLGAPRRAHGALAVATLAVATLAVATLAVATLAVATLAVATLAVATLAVATLAVATLAAAAAALSGVAPFWHAVAFLSWVEVPLVVGVAFLSARPAGAARRPPTDDERPRPEQGA